MIKIIIICLFLLNLFSDYLYSGDLILSKSNIVQSETLTLKYLDSDHLFEGKQPALYVYVFNANSNVPTGYNYMSTGSKADTIFYDCQIPDNAAFIIMKLGDGKIFDENRGQLWDLLIKKTDSIETKDANYFAALSYLSSFGKKIARIPDFRNALYYFTRENELYPDNLKASIALMSLNYELGFTDKTKYENELQSLLSSQKISIDNESEIEVILKALRVLGKNERVNEIRFKYIKAHPNSKTAQNYDFETLSRIDDFDEFVDKSLSFLKKFPKSDFSEKLYLAIIQSYIQKEKYQEIIELIKNSNCTEPEIYFQLAENLISNDKFLSNLGTDSRLKDAATLINIGFSKQIIDTSSQGLSPLDSKELESHKQIRYLTIKSDILSQQGKLIELDSIYNVLEAEMDELSQGTIKDILEYFYQKSNFDKIVNITEYLYLHDNKSDSLGEINKISYISLYPSGNYDHYKDSLRNIKIEHQLSYYRYIELSKSVELPTIKGLDNTVISTKIFKGKVILFYLFSYWCDACWDSFNELNELHNKYKENNDLVILPVILWSKDKSNIEEASKFLEMNKLDIPIYFDVMNETYKNLSITGVPTFILINKEGIIKYRYEGIDSNNEVYFNINNLIDKYLMVE